MKAVLTRVSSASVTIGGKVNGSIGKGFLILLGIGPRRETPVGAELEESRMYAYIGPL